ncbi:hypothetical protein AB0X56_02780 [Weissella paramesenteroides]|uniref:hypothetical protein n=1 Tax=Weissella paramesenteroides TaxID=1249 RepID=UPI003F29E5B2
MAFDSRLTIQHGLAMSNDIQRELDEAELDPTTADTIRRVAEHVRYYADLEDENVLSDIEDLRSEVADLRDNMPVADDSNERIDELADEVIDLKEYIKELEARL